MTWELLNIVAFSTIKYFNCFLCAAFLLMLNPKNTTKLDFNALLQAIKQFAYMKPIKSIAQTQEIFRSNVIWRNSRPNLQEFHPGVFMKIVQRTTSNNKNFLISFINFKVWIQYNYLEHSPKFLLSVFLQTLIYPQKYF